MKTCNSWIFQCSDMTVTCPNDINATHFCQIWFYLVVLKNMVVFWGRCELTSSKSSINDFYVFFNFILVFTQHPSQRWRNRRQGGQVIITFTQPKLPIDHIALIALSLKNTSVKISIKTIRNFTAVLGYLCQTWAEIWITQYSHTKQ